MTEESSKRIRLAWRRATDADVADGLRARDCVSDQVYAIIEAEARQRGTTEQDFPAHPGVLLVACQRMLSGAVRWLGVHPLLGGAVLGGTTFLIVWVGTDASRNLLPPEWLALVLGGPVLVLAVISWPLRFYRPCLVAALAAGLVNSSADLVRSLIAWAPFPDKHPGIGYFVVYAVGIMVGWAFRCAPVCLTIKLRNHYRPVHPEGHCTGCGYDLRGLPERRCPECGRSFDPDQQAPLTDPTEAD